MRSFVAYSKFLPAGAAAGVQNIPASHGTHPLAETMFVGALTLAGLVGTFHRRRSFLCSAIECGGANVAVFHISTNPIC